MSKRFIESEHKRDERGRFAEMNTSELKKQQEILIDGIPPVEYAYGFASKEKLSTKHHQDHAKEMGLNSKEYEKVACDFFNEGEGDLYYSERRKRFYRYDRKTKRMVASSDGIIHTFMLVSEKKFETKKKEDKLWKI